VYAGDPYLKRIKVILLNKGTYQIRDIRPAWMNDDIVELVETLSIDGTRGTGSPLFEFLNPGSKREGHVVIQLTESGGTDLPALLPFGLRFADVAGNTWLITPNNYVRIIGSAPVEDNRETTPGFFAD
jgi:hypothetical protein